MGIRKRQQQIYIRSLTLPPSAADIIDGVDSTSPNNTNSNSNGERKSNSDYCPHFLAALQLTAHVLIPLRKALIHFYVSYRSKDVQKLEWLTLLAFGRLFRDLITASNGSSSNSVMSGGTSSSANTGSVSAINNDVDPSLLQPVSSERFFPVLYTCLLKHDLERWPKDATEAIGVLLDCLKCCSRTLPVTNQLWSALLDKACLGLIARQSLVGRRKQETKDQKEVLQRSYTEQVILWCPHALPIGDTERIPTSTPIPISIPPPTPKNGSKEKDNNGDSNDDDDSNDDSNDEKNVPTLLQLMDAEFRKRPLSTTSRKYYDFDKKSYDFEVEIPTKFLDEKEKILMNNNNNDNENSENEKKTIEKWTTTRSMQFASLTGYLFLAIDRTLPPKADADADDDKHKNKNKKQSKNKIDRTELSIPSILDLTKLCSKKNNKSNSMTMPKEAVYELVGGALYDEGEYIAVLKDFAAVAAAEEKKSHNNKNNADDSNDEDEDETWKLMESEETIPMSESDVLEFLKGEGIDADDDADDSDEDDEEYGPCGTLAVYKLRSPPSSTTTTIFDEMNQLLSDIVISQVSGSLSSKTDFYIEEEVFEEEIIED